MGGAVAAVESGYMKGELVGSLAEKRRRIESGEDVVVGVNRFETTEPNPLLADLDAAIMVVDPAVENAALEAVKKWRAGRDRRRCDEALEALREAAETDTNLMAATLDCARAGVTTGEWAGVLREVFGEYRAPTGVAAASGGGEADESLARSASGCGRPARSSAGGCGSWSASPASTGTPTAPSRSPSGPATPASRSIYQGIRLTPAQIVSAAVEEDVHVVGLSVLSGSHMQVVPAVLEGLREAGLATSRSWSAGSSRTATPPAARAGRRAGVHAEGLRADRDHGRDRGRHPRGERARREGAGAGLTWASVGP